MLSFRLGGVVDREERCPSGPAEIVAFARRVGSTYDALGPGALARPAPLPEPSTVADAPLLLPIFTPGYEQAFAITAFEDRRAMLALAHHLTGTVAES